jgi:predicted ATPase/DNA-binding XRE family transcriptional regulator
VDNPQPFGLVLRRLRIDAGLTHEALAERAGLGARTISDLERGVSRAPRPDTLALLVAALHLSPEQRKLLEASARQFATPPIDPVASQASRNRLPAQLTTFVGREHETAAVRRLLLRNDIRLVTLTGPGGVGKTRLSLHLADELFDSFDGVFVIDLAPLTDPATVGDAIGQTLGVGSASPVSSIQLIEAIGQQSVLLLLDNFEHLLDAAPLVAGLLRNCPSLTVLVTSRAALHISGEQEYPVPPLPVPDRDGPLDIEQLAAYESIQLFVDRASHVRHEFSLTEANVADIAGICARLEGLPLALELAAARSKSFPPNVLLRELQRATDAPSLQLLAGGPRDVPARHQTLRDTIGWSYNLLPAADQALFRRLSVFKGGCTREQAGAVCRPLDVERGLELLIDHSLLYLSEETGGEPRIHMLETIAEFALERLNAAGETAEYQRRHAHYFLELVESTGALLFAPESKRARTAAEQGNLSAALSWLVQHG